MQGDAKLRPVPLVPLSERRETGLLQLTCHMHRRLGCTKRSAHPSLGGGPAAGTANRVNLDPLPLSVRSHLAMYAVPSHVGPPTSQ